MLLMSTIALSSSDSFTNPISCYCNLYLLCQAVSTIVYVWMAASCVVEIYDCSTNSISCHCNLSLLDRKYSQRFVDGGSCVVEVNNWSISQRQCF